MNHHLLAALIVAFLLGALLLTPQVIRPAGAVPIATATPAATYQDDGAWEIGPTLAPYPGPLSGPAQVATPELTIRWLDRDRIVVTFPGACVVRETTIRETICAASPLTWPPGPGPFDVGDFPQPGEVWRAGGAEAVVPARWRLWLPGVVNGAAWGAAP